MKDRKGLKEMVLATGQYGVPVVLVGDRAMVGWDPREFERLYALAPKSGTSNGPI
jgi:hypothetical protein